MDKFESDYTLLELKSSHSQRLVRSEGTKAAVASRIEERTETYIRFRLAELGIFREST